MASTWSLVRPTACALVKIDNCWLVMATMPSVVIAPICAELKARTPLVPIAVMSVLSIAPI